MYSLYSWLLLLIIPQAVLGQDLGGNSSQVSQATPMVWGPWTEWTECGQTCGHGTQYRIRRCHRSHSSGECQGPTKQLKICNVRDCPPWHEDYRSLECGKHDHIRYGGRTYRWVPYINEVSPCQLSCKSVGFSYYAKFKKSVADGITCNEEGTAICLKSQCVTSGCDGILKSGTVPDRCGVCGGKEDMCQLYSGIFTRTHLTHRGYNMVTTIPVGARQINISEMGRSKNYLAMHTPEGYILNGNLRLQREGSIKGAGTTFLYSRRIGPACKGECLTAEGPTNASIRVELLYFGRNPGITYSYTVPKTQATAPQQIKSDQNFNRLKVRVRNGPVFVTAPTYTRRKQQLNQRTSKNIAAARALANDAASGGKQVRRHNRRRHRGQRISALASNHRDAVQAGNRRDHRTSGRIDYQRSSKNDYQVTSSSNDYQRRTDRPDYIQPKSDLNSLAKNGQYRHYYHTNALDGIGDVPVKGEISRDDNKRQRGNSIQDDRSATTQGHNRPNYPSPQSSLDNTIPLPPTRRFRGNPSSRRTSSSTNNEIYSWRISGFTKCTEPCGGGLQETRVVCVKADSQVEVMEENCDASLKPDPTTVVCNDKPCKANWVVEDWGPCSVTCDRGLQKRGVTCKQRISPTLSISVPSSTCPSPRPQSRQYCQLDPCFVWKASNWTKCSTVCGLGQRTRDLTCVDWKSKKVSEDLCVLQRPEKEEICDMGSCAHGWFHSKWSKQCSSECGRGFYIRRVYCSAPDGSPLEHSKCGAEYKKPREKKTCRSAKPCGGQWFAGEWSKCNSTCGTDAFRQRDVLCIKKHGKRIRGITKNHNCDESLKPNSHEPCKSLPACKPQWYMMPWSKCSKSCDTGVRTREIKCVNENLKPSPDCDKKRRPARRQSCNIHSCQNDFAEFSDSSGPNAQVLQKDGTIIEVPSCEDKNSSRFCRLASQARMCKYPYYKKLCCKTCGRAGV